MKRLKNGTVMMELNQASKDKGYTMRANINPGYILLLKKCKQNSAAAIRAAIREIQNAKHYHLDLRDLMAKGHSFKDAICPDSLEFKKDHFIVGDKFGRVLFLKEYASQTGLPGKRRRA